MNRETLLRCLEAIAASVSAGRYDEWESKKYPIRYGIDFENDEVQVEIVLLEIDFLSIQVEITVTADTVSDETPPSVRAVIPRQHTEALERCLHEIYTAIRKGNYDEWVSKEYPFLYDIIFENLDVQVEIQLLEREPDYLHISIAVYEDSWASGYSPHTSAIMPRHQTHV